jgi:acyl CoA:acetate/3-ketoacid CoA transferase beta subunit
MVSGVGYDRVPAGAFHELRVVVTNLAVLDFATPDHAMRLRSVHPGVSVDSVLAATGFPLVVPRDVAETRLPTEPELALLRERLDPDGLREKEIR